MDIRSFFVPFIFLLLQMPSPAAQDVHIPFKIVNGLILLEAEINDDTQKTLIFDTGTSEIIIHGQPTSFSKQVQSLHGKVPTKEIYLQSMAIGTFRKLGINAHKVDLSALSQFLDCSVDGIVGHSFFNADRIYIDLKNKFLRINPEEGELPSHALTDLNPKIFVSNSIPILYLQLKDKTLKLGLDSGSSSHIISTESLEGLDYSSTPATRVISLSGTSEDREKILTRTPLWQDKNLTLFTTKELSSFNAHMDVPVDGFLALSKLPYDYVDLDLRGGQSRMGYFPVEH